MIAVYEKVIVIRQKGQVTGVIVHDIDNRRKLFLKTTEEDMDGILEIMNSAKESADKIAAGCGDDEVTLTIKEKK